MVTLKNKNNPILWLATTASAAVTLAAALSTDATDSSNTNIDVTRADANIDEDDDDGHFYTPHEGNSTLSATFSIRVTPEHYHMFSWTILWLCFASAVTFGMYQIRLERKWLKHAVATSASSSNSTSRYNNSLSKRKLSPSDPELGGGGNSNRGGGKNYTRSGGRLVRSSSRVGGSRDRMVLSASSASFNSISNSGNVGDEQQAVSTGDLARATFRRLLLFAMASRTIAIPIQIYSNPLSVQLIADTFPVMAFATAWTWLVSFFVQLVGVALGMNIHINMGNGINNGANSGSGGGSNSSSAHRPVATIYTVIQITAFVVYALLIISFWVFRRIAAAVLLYALLCCVYATLLGMGMYFCPRLLGLLLPGLNDKWSSPLALRLVACSSVCLLVFAAHTFSFAKKVVQSTVPSSHEGNGPYWWFQYGALEFLPGILFLVLLHPKRVPRTSSSTSSPNNSNSEQNPSKSINSDSLPSSGRRTPPLHAYHGRTDSSDSKSGSARMTPSPQPPRSPPPPVRQQLQLQQQQQQLLGGSVINSTKETTPLLSSHSNIRYSGALTAMSGIQSEAITSIDVHHQQLTGSDRSINSP